MISTTGLKRLALQDWDTGLPSHLQLILFACSTTLEDLMIHFRSRGELPSTAPVVPSTVVRLAALRRLELYEPPASFARTVDIECPNLETFTASYGGANYPWELPSWLPESISELNVKGIPYLYSILGPYALAHQITTFLVTVKSGFPQLSWGPIHPSRLTFEFVQYNGDMTRIGEYVDRLPFLDHLRQLTIKSFSNGAQLSFPDASRYEALYRFLQSLRRPTLSKRIILIIQIHKQELDIADTELDSIRTRELARLEEVFSPLRVDGLSIQLVVLLFGGNGLQRVLMRCSV
ncbi:hypothetical protein EYR38_002746 [Pleurotus pulmonarius]|nr:hypothetical protein EYR38_002746 [Pleurotus pulmonarius]